MTLISPPKLAAGRSRSRSCPPRLRHLREADLGRAQSIAVLSPSFAAHRDAPAVHEQAMARLTALTGAELVASPTTRRLGARPEDRAADLMAAMRDESIGAILLLETSEEIISQAYYFEFLRAHGG